MRQFALKSLFPLLVLLVGAVLVLRIVTGVDDVSLTTVDRPWLLAPALSAMTLTVLAYAITWRAILHGLDPARPRLLDSIAVFTSSWIGRHVPTSAPYIAGKVVLAEWLGHRRAASAASIVYENWLVVCVACVTCSAALWLGLEGGPSPLLWLVIAGAGAAGVAIIPTSFVGTVLRRAARLAPRLATITECQLSATGLVRPVALVALGSVINGTAFALVLASFVPLSLRDVIVAAAAFNLAGAAGVAAVPVPSGIGVREAVLVATLQIVVPLEAAVAAAVLARFLALPVDVSLAAAGAAWLTARRRRAPSRPEIPEPAPARAA